MHHGIMIDPLLNSLIKKERIPCNLCGCDDSRVIETLDRHGFRQPTVMCIYCGLTYLNPRMSAEGYDAFYGSGMYRDILAHYGGRGKKAKIPSNEKSFASGVKFGTGLAKQIRAHVGLGFTVEVGSGTGGVLSVLKSELGFAEVLGIEPSRSEADYAIRMGIPTEVTLFENFKKGTDEPENILCSQSLNHLLDPKSFLLWAYKTLAPHGKLVLVVQDFHVLARKIGSLRMATQIDHTFMFTPATLKSYLAATGFSVVLFENWCDEMYVKKGLSTHHMLVVAEKSMVIVQPPPLFKEEYRKVCRLKMLSLLYPARFAKKKLRALKQRFMDNL